jgi:hypothetical protein
MFLVEYVSAYLSQSVYFIGQYKKKDSDKNQISTILCYNVKEMSVGGIIFLRL